MLTPHLRHCTFVFALVASSAISFGQFESATVLGTVYDPSHAVLNNATVTLISARTGVKLETETSTG